MTPATPRILPLADILLRNRVCVPAAWGFRRLLEGQKMAVVSCPRGFSLPPFGLGEPLTLQAIASSGNRCRLSISLETCYKFPAFVWIILCRVRDGPLVAFYRYPL